MHDEEIEKVKEIYTWLLGPDGMVWPNGHISFIGKLIEEAENKNSGAAPAPKIEYGILHSQPGDVLYAKGKLTIGDNEDKTRWAGTPTVYGTYSTSAKINIGETKVTKTYITLKDNYEDMIRLLKTIERVNSGTILTSKSGVLCEQMAAFGLVKFVDCGESRFVITTKKGKEFIKTK